MAERGLLWIDVENPDNDWEILDKLQNLEFSRFLPEDQEVEDDDWTFEDVPAED